MLFTKRKKWGAGLVLAAALCLFAPQKTLAGVTAEQDGVMGQSIEDETVYDEAPDLDSLILRAAARTSTPTLLGASSYTSSFLNKSFTTSGDYTSATYYHKAEYEDYTMLNGIDVSWWQSKGKSNASTRKVSALDWESIHADGIDFAFVRVASRDSSSGSIYEDDCANSHIQGALANDINVGLYIFSQALTEKEAVAEADYVLKLVDKYGWDVSMPIVIDREAGSYKRLTAGKLSKSKETAVCQAFADTITAAGYQACVYAAYSWIKNYIDTSSLEDCSIWIARYNNTTTSNSKSGTAYSDVSYDYEFWQYASTAKVSGYSGNLDANFWYKDTGTKTTGLKVSGSTGDSVTLSWSKASDAKGYRVYRYDAAQAKYVYIGSTTKRTYTDTGLDAGTTYKYKVRCYWTLGGTNYYGAYSSAVSYASGPEQVENVMVTQDSDTTLRISWDSVENVSGYRIYQYDTVTDSFQPLMDVAADVTSYSFSGLEAAQVYRFMVKGYVLADTTYQWGEASEEGVYVTTPAAVGGLTAKYKSSTAITLSWDKVARATGYQIYRLNTASGSYKKIATVKGTSTVTYKNSGLSSGKEYTYQVRAYKSYDGENYYGSFSDAAAATTGPAKVGSLKLTTKSRSVTLKWSKVSGATGYQIYRLNTKTKKYEKIKTVKGTVSYKNTKLKKGTTYKYKVRAYRTYQGVTYYGSFSAAQKIKVK